MKLAKLWIRIINLHSFSNFECKRKNLSWFSRELGINFYCMDWMFNNSDPFLEEKMLQFYNLIAIELILPRASLLRETGRELRASESSSTSNFAKDSADFLLVWASEIIFGGCGTSDCLLFACAMKPVVRFLGDLGIKPDDKW